MKIAIVTDSITNLRQEDLQRFPFIRYVHLNVIVNGKSYLDLKEIDNKMLFDFIDQGAEYSTSQPSPESFLTVYEDLLKDHDYIFSLHCTENVSGTVNSGRLAKDLLESGKEKVAVIDTNTAAIGVENIVLVAARMIEAGKSVAQIQEAVDFYRENTTLRLTIDDLSTLVRSGRMTKTRAAIGNLLNIKPIIGLKDAKLDVVDKVRTKKRVVKWMVDALVREVETSGNQLVCITHVNAMDTATELKTLMEEACGDKIQVHISNEIGPVMAVHFGRGGFGANWIPAKQK